MALDGGSGHLRPPMAQVAVVFLPNASCIGTFPALRSVESLFYYPSMERGRIPMTWVIGVLSIYQSRSQLGQVLLARGKGRS